MIKLIVSELSDLTKRNKLITFSILSISITFAIIAGAIFAIKDFQSLENFYFATNLFQTSVAMFIEGITIGVLLNLISKRKKQKSS